ncbi:hypothetical protein CLG96_06510 [Sphingomonas oleivorans]|uniref:DUF2975 domain-containing protein n=1 Tax=Sphingomonas oleivorans TaxID=1735121 RepID=A0A2T5FZS2_9SPHN|nr:DUF2975 domain-containing protein [Sphingomonas oleivorans]PTQ12200.1 hypothetical protein CLG96_06510 [Sphingomonas oleivorans]
MRKREGLIWGASVIVRIACISNRLFLLAVAIGLAATWILAGFFGRLLAEPNPEVNLPAAMTGIRLLMLIGIAMAVATDRLLVPLAKIIATARAGDPFILANAQRLQAIGWALLALQLLDIPCALLARFWPSLGSAAPSGDVSVGGWIATLMVFVLSRVFAVGSVMRDELAGTV